MSRVPTRDRLLEAAQKLFHAKGYAASGNAEILRAAQAGAGSLYHHFTSKEELLGAILDRLGERLDAEIVGPALARSTDPVEQAFAILGFYREFLVATDCQLGCPVGNLAGELADSHDGVRMRIAQLFARWRSAVAGCLRRSGRLPPRIDADDLSTFVLTVMEGGVMQARVERSLEPFETSVRLLRDYFDRVLLQEEKP